MKGPNISDKFPNLIGSTQFSDTFNLYEYLGDSWGLLFLHPGDFTPVCTTELGTIAVLATEFSNRKVKICGFSCDDGSSHREWIRDIEYVTGIQVEFPLFCDPKREYSTMLNVLDVNNLDRRGMPLTTRGVYLLLPDKTIALSMMYPASVGRNIEEIIRCIDSIQSAGVNQREAILKEQRDKLSIPRKIGDLDKNGSADDSEYETQHQQDVAKEEPPAELFSAF